MRRDLPSEQSDRFSGKLRHYHRSSKLRRTWEDWVEGDMAKKRQARNWLKILGITFGCLALGGIVVGLILELR
ncbi:MAG: hypothetical protein ACRCXD_13745 [Luteolibacter sp.]